MPERIASNACWGIRGKISFRCPPGMRQSGIGSTGRGKESDSVWKTWLRISEMLVHDLLQSLLSSVGYLKVVHVMQTEEILSLWEDIGLPPGPEKYWLVFYGTPSMDEPWAWRFEGHHRILERIRRAGTRPGDAHVFRRGPGRGAPGSAGGFPPPCHGGGRRPQAGLEHGRIAARRNGPSRTNRPGIFLPPTWGRPATIGIAGGRRCSPKAFPLRNFVPINATWCSVCSTRW